MWTSSGSGKVKRLAHTIRVTVQACDVRGRAKERSASLDATAELVHGPEYAVIQTKVMAKYEIMTSITKFLGRVDGVFKGRQIPYGDCGVVITPAG